VQAPPPPAVAAGFWDALVAEGYAPSSMDCAALPASAIEASSAVPAAKLDGSV
jgi:hypothetical protein